MDLDAVLTTIAETLRDERVRSGLTLDQLAQRAEMSPAHLSRLETGDRQPSLAALITLARALGVSVGSLLGEGRVGPVFALFPDGAPSHEANGLAVVGCAGFPGSSALDALRITIDPHRIPPIPARHRGEEWVHVLRGRLRLEFDGQITFLDPGDSAHFDANHPHRLGADGVTTEVLVVAADSAVELRAHPLFSSAITAH
jgi:transcriptional regulator with XRE-family HTH domain